MVGFSLLTLHGKDALPFVEDIGRLRIEVFREFPYLYDGNLQYEQSYLQGYFACAQSIVGLVQSETGEIVGATTGLPLAAADAEWQQPFKQAQIPVEQVFYFGESVLRREWRGRGIGQRFFDLRENFASEQLGVKITAFCAVRRDANDPRRPAGYRPLDKFWQARGYQQVPAMSAQFEWLEVGERTATSQTLDFWLRRFR